jgi:RimJ/RimL family protein N-acetyltransferase
MTATIPAIYHTTVRLLKRMGFKEEGRKRQSLLMYGNKVDEMIFGLLAVEIL